jgi:dUTP pyrophosphatase
MTSLQVRIKAECPSAIPVYSTDGAAGCDLRFIPGHPDISALLNPGETALLPTGIAIEIPTGYEAQIRPRSSVSKRGLLVHVWTIDSDFRGQVHAVVTNVGNDAASICAGERVAQLIIAPVARASFEVVNELSETARGEGGFGSTGR